MKLQKVSIKRFRSIEECEIEECGDFNVLIGKNNSGKSNILSAIDTFFACISKGNIVTLDPTFGKEIDFFGRNAHLPIEITLVFSLSLAERDALIRDIVIEAPQRKNAIDGIDTTLLLAITVSIVNFSSVESSFGFISKMMLTSANISNISLPHLTELTMLTVNIEAALERRSELKRIVQENKNARVLNRLLTHIENVDIRTSSSTEERLSLNAFLRRFYNLFSSDGVSRELRQKLNSLANEATSYDDFSRRIRALSENTQVEGQKDVITQSNLFSHKVSTFAGEESSVPKYVLNLLKQIAEIKILYLKEQRKQIGKEEAEQILALKLERGGDETFRNIQSIVSSLLSVKINAFKSRGSSNAELDIDEFLVEVNGSGIREALRLVLDVLFEQPAILLVEEPEIHLHPALEISMMQYLKQISSNHQVFITTHSTNFLDTAEMKNVYLVSKPCGTQVQLVNLEEAEALIPRELGIRLSSLFMFDRLVFVEGRSDEDIIRAWTNTLGLNFSQANVGFVRMGGARNFTYFANTAALSFLKKRQVKMWFLIDRDERDASDIEKLKRTLSESATIKVLKKREIENYLLCPRAIVELMKQKQSLGARKISKMEPTESEVSQLIERNIEQLKQFTIDKRVAKILCQPIYPSLEWNVNGIQEKSIAERITEENKSIIDKMEEVINKADAVYAEQSALVDKIWPSEKLALVPGDHLLDTVLQTYDLRFKKEIDGSVLAGLMIEREIEEEIKSFIHDICS